MEKIEAIVGEYRLFLDKIFENLKIADFDSSEFKELDHIAYRTESLDEYEIIKNRLLSFSKAHDEKMFGGRLISVIQLENPLLYGEFIIEGLELLAPKDVNKYKTGLEHAEFVVKTTLAELMQKHSDVIFDYSAYDRKENPELIFKFENCAVKFHTQSLLEIRCL